jgi:hypothetical protein
MSSPRLRARLADRPDYDLRIGVPTDRPTAWARALRYTADEIVTAEGTVAVTQVRHFVIAYPNGQILDAVRGRLPVPDGLAPLAPRPEAPAAPIDAAEVARGLARVLVAHAPSRARPTSRVDYQTSLTNRMAEPVRISRFAAFSDVRGALVLTTVTGTWFTDAEFIAWYGAPADGWIAPGATVADPDNYGAACLWVYACEAASGARFMTGCASPQPPGPRPIESRPRGLWGTLRAMFRRS